MTAAIEREPGIIEQISERAEQVGDAINESVQTAKENFGKWFEASVEKGSEVAMKVAEGVDTYVDEIKNNPAKFAARVSVATTLAGAALLTNAEAVHAAPSGEWTPDQTKAVLAMGLLAGAAVVCGGAAVWAWDRKRKQEQAYDDWEGEQQRKNLSQPGWHMPKGRK